MKDLSNMDYLAVVWFALAAVGFTLLVDCSPLGAKNGHRGHGRTPPSLYADNGDG